MVRTAAGSIAASTLCLIALACGGDERIAVVLERAATADPDCGNPANASSVRISALGDFPASDRTSASIGTGESVTLSRFPTAIEAVAAEVLGATGTIESIGKTATFDFASRADGDSLSLFMAPLDGACRVTTLARPRTDARVAAIEGELLVLGGRDGDEPVRSVEMVSIDAGERRELTSEHYGEGEKGYAGTTLTPIADGAVAIGGPATAWQRWHVGGETDGPRFLPEARAFHAAVALDDRRVLLAGGCSQVGDDLECEAGSALITTSVLDIESGELIAGPRLGGVRIGGRAFLDRSGRVRLAGGTDGTGNLVDTIEVIDLTNSTVLERSAAAGAEATQLASGALVVGIGAHGDPSDILTFVGERRSASRTLPLATSGTRALATEDGQVLLIGGDIGLARLRPIDGQTEILEASALFASIDEYAVTLLRDGSVIIVGGGDREGGALDDIWRLRPPLRGPLANADLTARFSDDSAAAPLIPSNLDSITVVDDPIAYAELSATSDGEELPTSFAVVAGPRYRRVVVTATIATTGGVGLALGYDPAVDSTAWMARLLPEQPVDLVAWQGDEATPLAADCAVRETVSTEDLGGTTPSSWVLTADDGELSLRAGERLILRCGGLGEPPAGFVAIGVLGDAGDTLRIDALSTSRRLAP